MSVLSLDEMLVLATGDAVIQGALVAAAFEAALGDVERWEQ